MYAMLPWSVGTSPHEPAAAISAAAPSAARYDRGFT
jgi:hypothetical protein